MTKLIDAVPDFTKTPKKPTMVLQVTLSFTPPYAKLGLAALPLSLSPLLHKFIS
jgi:hypothetical protein